MRAELFASAMWLVAVAVSLSCLMVVVFDWSPSQMALGALIGTAVWSTMHFLTEVRHQVPEGTRLLAAPSNAIVDGNRWRPVRLLLLLPVLVGLAWLADRWELGAVFIPGQYAGYAVANLAGVVLVGRWENRNGGTVLLHWNGDEPELYAA